jgi:phosphoglycolate phosphatase
MESTTECILWDWNGTLLDDTAACLEGINRLLIRRDLPSLDLDRYRDIFTFPVIEYYRAAGFDFSKEPFEIPALEFINEYHRLLPGAPLFNDVERVLSALQARRCRQFILSAMEQQALLESVDKRGIRGYFEGIYGIGNHLAFSKMQRGRELLRENDIYPDRSLLIGDTLHDRQVAHELGLEAILVSRGHQSRSRLVNGMDRVFGNLLEVMEYLLQGTHRNHPGPQ